MAPLKKGARGADVRRLQSLLNAMLKPSPGLFEDGDFGKATHDAVLRLQKINGLTADGIVGDRTWTVLGQKSPKLPAPLPVPAGSPKWLKIAADEIGTKEFRGKGKHNPDIVGYHGTTTLDAEWAAKDETAWCSSFVNWVMIQAGYRGTNNALARSWLAWGRELDAPLLGAVTVIKKKGATSDKATGSTTGFHVGFWLAGGAGSVTLLGGNQGDQVKRSTFGLDAWEVKGYRWPG